MKRTVLIVDDDGAIRQMLSMVLITEGYHVLTAWDGYEALDLIRQHKPDAVVLDVMMPRLSGLDTLDRLHASDGPDVVPPVIMLTARVTKADQIEGYRHGATAYLPKPTETTDLLSLIAEVCGPVAPVP